MVTTTNAIKSAEFFTGGNATFTVSNPQGVRYTFRIRKPDERAPYFVSLMTGPDNESSYTYMGLYNPVTGQITPRGKTRFTADSEPVKVANWAVRAFNRVPPGYSIQHAGKCCRCGRKLTTPESIDLGIGPECIKARG